MTGQIRTFTMRLPAGPHEAMLDRWADLSGRAKREIHAALAMIHREVATLPVADRAEALSKARNDIKSSALGHFGITGRQYNGLEAEVTGLWKSRRELAGIDVDRLGDLIVAKAKSLAAQEARLSRDAKARGEIAARAPKPPTKAQAKAVLLDAERRTLRFAIHQGKRRLAGLQSKLAAAKAMTDPLSVPDICFGSKDLLRERALVHRNDRAGLARWRAHWEAARNAGFMLIGGADEASGNKSCQASLDDAGHLSLVLRLPDALAPGYNRTAAKMLTIRAIALPAFAAPVARAVLGNTHAKGRVALTWRFIRDHSFKGDSRLSAWRVCCTLREEMPATMPVAGRPVLGMDLNADHLALALVSADGNPTRTWRIGLDLRGKSTGQRRAICEAAAQEVSEIARAHSASIALEDLDFGRKKREISLAKERLQPEHPAYARMLSALPYAMLGKAIMRRAARDGVAATRVNPAYTSLIGEVNWSRRYGLTRHQAAAVAIARRAQGFSERINYVFGLRRRRSARPSPADEGRHVWRQWAGLHRERRAAARAAHKALVHPSGGGSPGSTGRGVPRGSAREKTSLGAGDAA